MLCINLNAQDTLYLNDLKSLRFEKYGNAIIPIANFTFNSDKKIVILSDSINNKDIGSFVYTSDNKYYEFKSGVGQTCKIKSLIYQYSDTVITTDQLKHLADSVTHKRGIDYYCTEYFVNIGKDFSKEYYADEIFPGKYFRIYSKYDTDKYDRALIGVADITNDYAPYESLTYMIYVKIK